MTLRRPPRLALLLLHRVVPEDDPLVGDLVEAFARGRSRLWFWRETWLAVANRRSLRAAASGPLSLGDRPAPLDGVGGASAPPRSVNLTASPLPGVGGLGLAALGVIVAVLRPHAWWIFVPAIAGGALLACVLSAVRRVRAR